MAGSLNAVQLIGHLGRDPEVRYMANGSAVANISLATTRRWNDRASGEKKEQTEWHRLVVYERLAEVAEKYLKKGSLIFVGGRLQTRKWEDKEGIERYTTEIVVHELQMLDKLQHDNEHNPDPDEAPAARTADRRPAHAAPNAAPKSAIEDMDDDIPF